MFLIGMQMAKNK